MPKAWMVRAGAALLLVLAVGCRVPEFLRVNYLQAPGPGGDRVVLGSLEAVAQSTESSLQQLGFSTVQTREGQDIRIACTTRRGGTFHFVLTQVATAEGERTRIQLDLETSQDKDSGTRILGELDLQKGSTTPAGGR